MGRGTSILLLILLAKDEEMRLLSLESLPKSPDKRHSPCHNLLPLFLGGLPDNLPSSLASLEALVAPYVLGVDGMLTLKSGDPTCTRHVLFGVAVTY